MLGLVAGVSAQGPASQAKAPVLTPAQAQKKLNQKSSRFIQNAGQWDSRASFLGRSSGMDMWVTREGVTYDFYRSAMSSGNFGRTGQVVGMSFAGGNGGSAQGVTPMRMTTRYVDSARQVARSADSYREVLQKGIYPGVDARSYFDHGLPRYDLIVAPGANPDSIKLAFKGANSVSLRNGEIVLGTKIGDQKHGKLYAYQVIDGKKKQVPASFKLVSKNTVGFELGAYDTSKRLVIDPLIYGSYYGGNAGLDEVRGVTTDTKGGVYMTGYTTSAIFPALFGPYGFAPLGARDAFISKLQGDAYSHDYAAYFGGSAADIGVHIGVDPFGDVWVAGTTNSSNFPGGNLQYLRLTSANPPTSGTFTITYPGIGTTAPLPYNASPKQVENALVSLLGVSKIYVSFNSGTGVRLNNRGVYKIMLPPTFPQTPTVDSTNLSPAATYAVPARTPFIFLMRWAQSSSEVLTPFPQTILYFGGEQTLTLAGFGIVPNSNPASTDPVRLTFAGNQSNGAATNSDIPDVKPTPLSGYIARFEFDRAARTITRIDALTKFVSSGDGATAVDLSGVSVDRFGSIYTGGTIRFGSNVDTAVNPVFLTTPGVFEGGRLLRRRDLFVRKYSANGSIVYSALIGGNNNDAAGGYDFDPTGATNNVGSTIAVDEQLNLYITGISGSFNFPRTRGVFGEVFNDTANVTVTKVNPDASQILYSTNLQTAGTVLPAGVAVDARGFAFVTGNVHFDGVSFPDADAGGDSTAAGNPNELSALTLATIQLTADALDPTNSSLLPPIMGTTEGFINVLNDTATTLVYGSYVGGELDEHVFAPYVDGFGDVWYFGSSDTVRRYVRTNSTGVPTIRQNNGTLPAELISPLAFKRFPDSTLNGGETLAAMYGVLNPLAPFYTAFSWPSNAMPPGSPLPTVPMMYQRDGFLIKQRIGLAAIGTISVNPTTAPGGLGVVLAGQVTLTDPAPVGGAELTLTLNDGKAATFDNGTAETTLFIPGGQTVGTFNINTQPVQTNTNVQVRATYQGSFKIAQFVVVPWLQQLSLSPTSVVGGNQATGRITLAAPAPVGGATVDLLTDTPSLISFPGGSTVNVPEGQTSVVFTIDTQGVSQPTFPTVRASLLGVGKTQTLTLTQANLQQLLLSPSRVAGGSTVTGTVVLDGKAGSSFQVVIRLSDGTPGYVITPKTITFNAGETQQTFEIKTAFESSNTTRKVIASRAAQGTYPKQQLESTLFIDAVFLTGFTLNPGTIDGGDQAQGVVTISAPAPAGGVVVNLKSSDTTIATVPATVTVPAGASTTQFDIDGQTIAVDKTVTITAGRGPTSIARSLTVRGVTFTLDLDPPSLVGGRDTGSGIITLSSPAPAGGVTVKLKSSNTGVATVPATVTIPQGQSSTAFPITTNGVSSTRNVSITATLGVNAISVILEVRAVGVLSVQFTPDRVRGGNATLVTVTLEAAAPAGGANVSLAASNPDVFAVLPSSVHIDAGQTSVSFTLRTRRVSRDLASTLTATYGGSSASATLSITR